jgi:hypothetical protein
MFYIRLAGALSLCVLAGGLICSGQPNIVVLGALCIAAALCMVPSHKHIKEYSA